MEESRDQPPSQPVMKVISKLLESGTGAVVVTLVAGRHPIGSKLLIEDGGKTLGSLGSSDLDSFALSYLDTFLRTRDDVRMINVKDCAPEFVAEANAQLLFEQIRNAPRLVVCGAGHVGAALARLGVFVGYATTLIDDRAEFLTKDRFAEAIELVVAHSWGDAVRHAIGTGRAVAVAVVTRGHNEDEECLRAVMDTRPDYVGLIGSKRRTNIVIDNLRRSGVLAEELKKVRAPIGLDIGAVTPEEVALAIIAEIVAERRGGHGGSLSAWRRAVKD